MAEAILDYAGGEIRARLEKSHKTLVQNVSFTRSEERRVGKEC